MSLPRLLLPACAFLLGLGSAASADAQTVINSVPYTISVSGKYVLGNNFITASASQVAITINVANVILDLNGFFVSGPGNSTTSSQSVISVGNVGNVTIRNGTVANNCYGIRFTGALPTSINHLVENVNITHCLLYGFYFNSSSAGSIIRTNTISQIGGYTGSSLSALGVYCFAGVSIENNFINSVTGGTFGGNTGDGYGIDQDGGSFAIGNKITNCTYGVKYGKYKDNLTDNVTTPFSGGIDVGGNN